MKKLWLLFGAVLVLVMGAMKCEEEPPPTPGTGEIAVNSTPEEGALITLDGSSTGKLTNTVLADIDTGSHTIKLTLVGYKDFETTVTVTGGDTATVNATLESEDYGSLTINSTPTGAFIWLDGSNTDKQTPATIDSLSVGSHTVKLTLANYEEYEETVTIEKDETTTINQTLTLKTGTLTVNSTPTGAAIELDGSPTGQVTNVILNVDYGSHTVKLTLDGYKDWEGNVTIDEASGGTGTIDQTLEEDPMVEVELALDEATPVGFGFKMKAGHRLAVMFTPPSYPFELTQACYVPMGWADDPDRWNTECDLVFFAGNADNGPTSELGRTSASATQAMNFNWFDVSGLDITIESGNFFFAIENKVNDNPGLALDGQSPEHHVSWMYTVFIGEIDPKWAPFDNITITDWPDDVYLGDSCDVILRVKGMVPAVTQVVLTPTELSRSTYFGWPQVRIPADMIAETPYFDPRNYR